MILATLSILDYSFSSGVSLISGESFDLATVAVRCFEILPVSCSAATLAHLCVPYC